MKFLIRAIIYTVLLFVIIKLLPQVLSTDGEPAKALQQYASKAQQRYLCQTPIAWRIGQLDPAFSLTLDQAEQAAHNAAMQWNKALGFEVFRYDSIDGFPINFAYDERQQFLLQQALLQRNIERYDQNIDQRLTRLKQQSASLRQKQQAFEEENKQFMLELGEYEQRLQQSSADASSLHQARMQLQMRQQALQQQADILNTEQERLTREQEYLNDTVADRNAMLPQQDSLKPAPEVGLMQVQAKERTMTIFAYKTLTNLQLTMAHEFGHALGIEHTDDVSDVMHFALTNQQRELTAADVNAAKAICGW